MTSGRARFGLIWGELDELQGKNVEKVAKIAEIMGIPLFLGLPLWKEWNNEK